MGNNKMGQDKKKDENGINNINVSYFFPLVTPGEIKTRVKITSDMASHIGRSRQMIRSAMHGIDKRPVIITGPCSIHDVKSALEYAHCLAKLKEKIKDKAILIMRVYFEKPRTTIGWKGLLYDPYLDETNDMNCGLQISRELLFKINEMGIPCATEFLDPIVPQYISDLISWACIGARTTESQTHRQMASGLSMPVGFKNPLNGDLKICLNALISARNEHSFIGIDLNGQTIIVGTKGNKDAHLVLRGMENGPNYGQDYLSSKKVIINEYFSKTEIKRPLLIDCSHGNTGKDYKKQPEVFLDVWKRMKSGEEQIILGMMLESNLLDNCQDISTNMVYGRSITDACIDWETTENLLLSL